MTKENLEDKIQLANVEYWINNNPSISDADYDDLINMLKEIEPHHPLVTQIESTPQNISDKIKHIKPMLSLDKAYSLLEVEKWFDKVKRSDNELISVSPKYDGVSGSLDDGILSSRGDGEIGENLTNKLSIINKVTKGNRNTYRGEILITNQAWDKTWSEIKRDNGETFKNSRNAVAGILNNKDISGFQKQNKKAKLTFIDFEYFQIADTFRNIKKHFPNIETQYTSMGFPLDGIVFKIHDKKYFEELGYTSHHSKAAIALKFKNKQATTKLINIKWGMGKNTLTPLAVVELVEINGITINHATLHNYENIIKKNICVGDVITIERAGDVIPYVAGNKKTKDSEKLIDNIPSVCPFCNSSVIIKGVELCCTNDKCEEKLKKRLHESLLTLGVDRCGFPTVEKAFKLIDKDQLILPQFLKLTLDQIKSMEGFGEKSSQILFDEIQKVRNDVEDWKILASMNWHALGKTIFKKVFKQYNFSELLNLSKDQLLKIDLLGDKRVDLLHQSLQDELILINELFTICKIIETKEIEGEEVTNKPTICFSGKQAHPRSEMERIAIEHGFIPSSSVNKDLGILVVADPESSSSKTIKAKKLGITIMKDIDWLLGKM